MARSQHKSRCIGISHKRKMEIKREERLKAQPNTELRFRPDLVRALYSSRRSQRPRRLYKSVYGNRPYLVENNSLTSE